MRSQKTRGWNGYLDWAEQHASSGDAGNPELWQPVFVRSVDDTVSSEDFFASVDAEAGYTYDPFEKTYNGEYRAIGEPVEAFLFRKYVKTRTVSAFENSFEVLHVGAPSQRRVTTRAASNAIAQGTPVPVAIGIIDDGIAYLHPRFQNGLGQTRFAAVLLQTLATHSAASADLNSGGLELGKADLDADLARLQSASEDEIYRTRHNAVYDAKTRHSMRQAATHGTLMLDMAAGADPVDPEDLDMRDVPLLAVQLPPEAFEDTSGVRMQSHIIQGLRWMIYRAFAGNLTDELIVNISLGVVAGPKNGGSFFEQQVKREIERVTQHYHGAKTLELVFAYGNAYEDGLVARTTLAPSESRAVALAVQPDDRTPSFVELRLTDLSETVKPKKIEVTLSAPDGTSKTRTLRKGRHVTFFGSNAKPIARLYHTPERIIWGDVKEPGYLTLAFAPTRASKSEEAVAPSGQWQISCRNVSSTTMDLTLQVQRDDSPFSRNTGSRQAYFEDTNAREWNAKTRDYSALGSDSIITHEGTNSAFATVAHDNVHSVGAAIVSHPENEPAEYTAQGADWSGSVPNASALAQATRHISGVLGAGTFASSTARLSGTSSAAASYTRHLVHPAETQQVASAFDRLGTVTVLTNPAIKDQRRD